MTISNAQAPQVSAGEAMQAMYMSLGNRVPPATVACHIRCLLPSAALNKQARRLLEQAASAWYPSCMPSVFWSAEKLDVPVALLYQMMGLPMPPEDEACELPAIEHALDGARVLINAGALAKRERNRLFKLIRRLDRYVQMKRRQELISECARFGKTGFASSIAHSDFKESPHTAALIAHLTANMGRRSIFTVGKQARAFDELADALFRSTSDHNWFALAHVFPRADVVEHLSETQKVHLLDMALGMMRQSSDLLAKLAQSSDMQIATMIVRCGDDSTTWNQVAGAWNRARDMWLAMIVALGAESVLEVFMPTKAMRLMAGDVASWHAAVDGEQPLDPDTAAWRDLPKPWECMSDETPCPASKVYEVCATHGIDADAKGWTSPRMRLQIAPWIPNYDTVCGIQMAHPEVAWWLRKVGMFTRHINLHPTPVG